MRRDAYELLGVERGAPEQQIKRPFGRSRELHPDVNAHDPEAEEKFKEAGRPTRCFSDPERRAVYDRYGWEGLDSRGYALAAHGFGSFADIFDAFFGGDPFGGGARGPRAVQGGDVGVEVEISLAEAASGTTVEVSYDAVETCGRCHGNRAEPGTPIETCERCGGSGQLRAATRTAFGQLVRAHACDVCGGEGKVARTPCVECGGEGRRAGRRALDVNLPAGIADDQRVRLAGRGHARRPRGPPGDLYVLVSVTEDERFLRDGAIWCRSWTCRPGRGSRRQGDRADARRRAGAELEPGTQPGTVITLRGRGMPQIGRNRSGDQKVVLNVVIPRNLTERQRDLLEELDESVTEDNLREVAVESLLSKVRRAFR